MTRNLLPSIIIAAGFFLLFTLALPVYDAVKETGGALEESREMLAQRQAAKNSFDKLNQEYNGRAGEINKVLASLPKNSRVDQIISSLQAGASQSGLQLRGITIGQTTASQAGPFRETPINLVLAGNYPSFVNFLAVIEKSVRVYDLARANMAKDPTAGPGLLNINLSLTAYSLE